MMEWLFQMIETMSEGDSEDFESEFYSFIHHQNIMKIIS